jgi:hypothetical protein
LPTFVTCRGGEYFMLPGLRALELICSEAREHARPAQRAASHPDTNTDIELAGETTL